MALSEFEIAVQTASDRLAIDMARYKADVGLSVADARAMVIDAFVVGGNAARGRVTKALDKAHARVSIAVRVMMDDLNYRHQKYLAEELGRLGGVNVRLERVRGEVTGIRVIGKSAGTWIDEIFTRTITKARRAAGYSVGAEKAAGMMDDLELGVMRTLMIFMAAVDVDNKVRTVEALTQALGRVGVK